MSGKIEIFHVLCLFVNWIVNKTTVKNKKPKIRIESRWEKTSQKQHQAGFKVEWYLEKLQQWGRDRGRNSRTTALPQHNSGTYSKLLAFVLIASFCFSFPHSSLAMNLNPRNRLCRRDHLPFVMPCSKTMVLEKDEVWMQLLAAWMQVAVVSPLSCRVTAEARWLARSSFVVSF